MTRDELLAALLIERFGPDAAQAIADYDDTAAKVRETFAKPWPPPTTRRELIGDLPPDSRPGPVLVVRAAP